MSRQAAMLADHRSRRSFAELAAVVPREPRKELITLLQARLTARGMTTSEVAVRSGVSHAVVAKIFRPDAPLPQLRLASQILTACQLEGAEWHFAMNLWRTVKANAEDGSYGIEHPAHVTGVVRENYFHHQPVAAVQTGPKPQSPVEDKELKAATPAAFVDLLRHLQVMSGLRASQIAIKAEIPRSQAYAMIKEGRDRLPTRGDQVRGFVQACGLPPHQVQIVLRIWARLIRDAQQPQASAEVTPSPAPTRFEADLAEMLASYMADRELSQRPGRMQRDRPAPAPTRRVGWRASTAALLVLGVVVFCIAAWITGMPWNGAVGGAGGGLALGLVNLSIVGGRWSLRRRNRHRGGPPTTPESVAQAR